MKSLSDVYASCNFCVVEPKSFEETIKEETWKKAMEEKIKVIKKKKTWELVEKPKDRKVISMKQIYKLKFNSNGFIQKNKARLVAKEYSQQPKINFEEIFALMA